MINHSLILDFVNSEHNVDKTICFEWFCVERYVTLSNCGHTGSSLFLKTLACFLDKSIDTKSIFEKMSIGGSEIFPKEINSYRVLWLDFSDFHATNHVEAIEYLQDKMSDVYKDFIKYFEINNNIFGDYRSYEFALDIIEKKSSIEDLQRSLQMLLLHIKRDERYDGKNKFAILIDNLVQLETVADDFGYSMEMNRFLNGYIVEDVYKHCDFFLQIGDASNENDSWFLSKKYMAYRYFSVIDNEIQTMCPELIVPKEKQYVFKYNQLVSDLINWDTYIADGRKTIEQCKYDEEQRRLEHIRLEKERYAEDLSHNIPLFSPNLGIRHKHLNKNTNKYCKLNNLIKDIYSHFCPVFSADAIYAYFQKLNINEQIVTSADELADKLEKLSQDNPLWSEAIVNSSLGYWVQVQYPKADDTSYTSPNTPENIKVYASFSHIAIQNVFVDSLKYLLQNAEDTFGAKIATCNRSDQMCYWLSVKDFKQLEDFFRPYYKDMVKSLPFVAYKGMLGISKDFPGVDDSHNSTQAHIISDYLRTVNNIEDIDLESMYNLYIAKWNADIYDENPYGGFKNNSALSFIVILDTLDAIMNETGVTEDSLLLSGDKKIWRMLSKSRCWADINAMWK